MALLLPHFLLVFLFLPALQGQEPPDIPFGHLAFEGYKEPPYFQKYEDFLGADYMKRCVKRRDPPPDGQGCRKEPKACLWGEQTCPNGEIEPTTRCDCENQVWSCYTLPCPGIEEVPSFSPTKTIAPTALEDVCSPDSTLLVFLGADELLSYERGQVAVSWSPGFAVQVETEEFYACGESTYDIFLAPLDYVFDAANVSNLDLFDQFELLTTQDPARYIHVTTNQTDVIIPNAPAGEVVNVLVVQNMELYDLYSFNRKPSSIQVSAFSPEINPRFTKFVNVSEEGTHTVSIFNNTVVTYTAVDGRDTLPSGVLSISPLDFSYIVSNQEDKAILAQLIELVNSTANSVSWRFEVKGLDDIYDELDFYATANSIEREEEEEDDDDEEGDEEIIDIRFLVEDNGSGRHLRGRKKLRRFIRKIGKGIKRVKKAVKKIIKAAKKIVKAAKKLVKFVAELITDGESSLSESLRIIDFHRGTLLSCEFEKSPLTTSIDLGARMDVTLDMKLSVTITLKGGNKFVGQIDLVTRASGAVFAKLSAELLLQNEPDPVRLWAGRKRRKVYFIGPVPVVVSHQPSLDFFHSESLELQAEASFGAEVVFTVTMTFGIRNKKFFKEAKQTQELNVPNPVLSGQLSVGLEAGLTLSINAWLYGTVRGTAALDGGATFDGEVGTELDAILVAPPWYTLNKFEGTLFLRLNLDVGLDGPLADLINALTKGIKSGGVPDPQKCKIDSFFDEDSLDSVFQSTFGSVATPALPVSADPADPKSNFAAFIDVLADGSLDELATVNGLIDNANFADDSAIAQVQDIVNGIDKFVGNVKDKLKKTNIYSLAGITVFDLSFPIFAVPTPLEVKGTGLSSVCQEGGDTAASFTFTGSYEERGLFKQGVTGTTWYTDLDGWLFDEDTAWIVSNPTPDKLTLRLPRSVLSGQARTSLASGNLYYRATPELFPSLSNALYIKKPIKEVLGSAIDIQCCDESDCALQNDNIMPANGFGYVCSQNNICTTAPFQNTARGRIRNVGTQLVLSSPLVDSCNDNNGFASRLILAPFALTGEAGARQNILAFQRESISIELTGTNAARRISLEHQSCPYEPFVGFEANKFVGARSCNTTSGIQLFEDEFNDISDQTWQITPVPNSRFVYLSPLGSRLSSCGLVLASTGGNQVRLQEWVEGNQLQMWNMTLVFP